MIDTELVKIVGKENTEDHPDALGEYAENDGHQASRMPAGVVKPADCEELQAIVKWANEKHTPLVPVSSGPPHFRGDTIPGKDGAVIVDLRRMNKILRINAPNRVALVEPGVTFGRLQAELAKEGLSAYLPLLPRATKSVLTSALERDPITMPCIHFDSTDPMLCAEIIFGSGDKMRTGEAAGPDTLEQQWELGKAQISPFGPTQMDPQRLVAGAQGTIGIVSWMSIKCRFLSERNSAFLIPSQTLPPLIDLSYKLTNIRFTGNIFIVDRLNLAALLRLSAEEIKALGSDLPPYIMFVSCEGYGPLPEEKVQYLEEDLHELSKARGLEPKTAISGLQAQELSALLAAPSPEPYWKQRLKGGFAELFFLTTQGKTPEFADAMADILQRHQYPADSMGMYIQPVVMGTSCHCEFDFYYNPANQDEVEKTRALIVEAADKMESMGAFFSRPFAPWNDVAYRNCKDTADMQIKVKGLFDPNGIMNPGHLCFQ